MDQYRKAWVAGAVLAVMAGLEVAKDVITMSDNWRGLIMVLLAAGGAFLTWAVPNAPKPNVPADEPTERHVL